MADNKTLCIAHRGASSLAPENTLAAAQLARQYGADMWELDVCTTADGELILLHDQTLERTSNVIDLFPDRWPWQVCHFTFSEIRRLDFGAWFNSDVGVNGYHANRRRYVGEPAPTLQEALAFTRDQQWRVNVEIKDLRGTPCKIAGVEKVVAMIESMQMVDNVIISSFNHAYLKLVKAMNPKVATGALVHRVVHNPIPVLRRLDAQAYHPHLSAIRLENIGYLRQQGFEVNVWTVNDRETALKLREAGATGIFTDFPQLLLTWLEVAQNQSCSPDQSSQKDSKTVKVEG